MSNKYSIYNKDVSKFKRIDVYRVIKLWNVTDPGVQHAVKKLLNAGERGPKSFEQDLREAVDSVNRSLQMIAEDDSDVPSNPAPLTKTLSQDDAKAIRRSGYDTAYEGGMPMLNPWAIGTERAFEWASGWQQGHDASLKRGLPQQPAAPAPAQAAPACPPMPAQAPAPEKPATVTPAPALGPYTQGREACRKGSNWNPYNVGSTYATQWQNGYEDEIKQALSKMPEVKAESEAYAAGYKARTVGARRGTNPYHVSTPENKQWIEGWQAKNFEPTVEPKQDRMNAYTVAQWNEVVDEGKVGFGMNKTIADNPYKSTDWRSDAWANGYKSQLS